MPPVIKVENLSKAYQLGEIGTGTISRDLERYWARLRGKEDPFLKIGEVNIRSQKGQSDIVWSLKDLNFNIEQGDAVGIIGKNGAGKSTLLKILSRVTAPTRGSVKVKGRIASLLEVGTGFHPELSGKENIYLNGAILGMRKSEIRRKFDEIVEFSGVERYIDTPVKRYSSGMYVRLAFAVAAHLESEILIIDEVLAVGDAEFQRKCLGKMGQVSQGEGRTVLFVSHNMDSITRLCNAAIYLDNGQIRETGESLSVINSYLSQEGQKAGYKKWDRDTAPGNHLVKLRAVRIIDEKHNDIFNISINNKVGVEIVFEVFEESDNYVCGFNLFNGKEVHILSSHDLSNSRNAYEKGIYKSTVWIPENFLLEGPHLISVALMSYNPFTVIAHELDAAHFNITDQDSNFLTRGNYGGTYPGVVHPELHWSKVNKISHE
ncbi:ABC transporter ATP-binding protein [Mucilaginibacter angelicae]|uniref:ABC transporter ATP-binding protein n=1 Tax=Mucilaginibacter angelicae TaxID=869718 RepID=A0ABV6L525_9SPHI